MLLSTGLNGTISNGDNMNGLKVLFLKDALDQVSEWFCEVIRNHMNKN